MHVFLPPSQGNVIILEVRSQFVDYLPAVGIYQGGVYLPSLKYSQNIDWIAFLRPFQLNSWIIIGSSLLISTIISSIIWYFHESLTVMNLTKIIWSNFQAFLAEASNMNLIEVRQSNRMASVFFMIWAWFIWSSYNASLSSQFTVPLKKLPFTDMETLSMTDYRLD